MKKTITDVRPWSRKIWEAVCSGPPKLMSSVLRTYKLVKVFFLRSALPFFVILISVAIASTMAAIALAMVDHLPWHGDFYFLSLDYWRGAGSGEPSGGAISRSEVVRNLGLALAAFVGLAVALWRLILAGKQQILAERGLITNRFNEGVKNLGSKNSAVCAGGIDILWRLIREIPDHDKDAQQDDVQMILNLLLYFIRSQRHLPRPAVNPQDWLNISYPSYIIDDKPYVESHSDCVSSDSDGASLNSNEITPVFPSIMNMVLELLGFYGDDYRSILSEECQIHINHLDLRGAFFNRYHLPYVNAIASDMSHAVFSEANLANGIMRKANLSHADFGRTNCEKADFSYSLFNETIFVSAYCRSADFSYANLQKVNFLNADCRNAKFIGVTSSGAKFRQADLGGAKFISAKLDGGDFTNSRSEDAQFVYAFLRGANFSYASLKNADFKSAVLDKADFSWATLIKAKFQKINTLQSHHMGIFHNLPLRDEHKNEVSMVSANLSNADLSEASLREADLSKANFQGANLTGANLCGVNLTGADLTSAKNLTQEQINSAACEQDDPPKLPENLTPPTQTPTEYKEEAARKLYEKGIEDSRRRFEERMSWSSNARGK